MSPFGTKRTCGDEADMSAFRGRADMPYRRASMVRGAFDPQRQSLE
jgi:hypothetical protein